MKKPAPFGKYYLLERINVGGMAEVFRAKAFGVEGFERLVAVKRILPNIAEDKEFIRMFIEEAKLAVQLNHANIAQIFDLGVVDGAYYIALEHVHGRDVRGIFDRCRNSGEAMPVAQACFVVMKVCEGLDYAHNKRDQGGRELSLVHRDVSPQNVIISFEGEVKLIDFGIAKAAGKGSKTQAGILKGKFGYMSPEQVRGLPIDRRSDVFSCGIVLYELLTGERLFVGESDFSTLEKVRNVEILPPSTYNRKIPDELERIVLKALAKDTEDRYQNAIDLHDELQAFVYTAGEFYSRKDLAGWMKKTFGREIEEETAKLESYRQLKPPPQDASPPHPPAAPRTITGNGSGGARAASPAEKKPRRTEGMSAAKAPPPPPDRRSSGQMSLVTGQHEDSASGLSWDDDELETQIYDNPEDDPKNGGPGHSKNHKPLPRPAASAGRDQREPVALTAAPDAPTKGIPSLASSSASMSASAGSPDLSSLVSTARGWEGGPPPSSPGMAVPAATNNGMGQFNGSGQFAAGSSGKAHLPPPHNGLNHNGNAPTLFDIGSSSSSSSNGAGSGEYESNSGPFSSPSARQSAPFDPMASAGYGAPYGGYGTAARKDNKKVVYLAVGGAAVVAGAVVLIIAMSGGSSTPKPPDTQGSASVAVGTDTTPTPTTPTVVGDANTGFDLYVKPSGLTKWKLDGELRNDRLPSRIRGIAPGRHVVQIDPPAGFLSERQEVQVELGKAQRVDISLQQVPGITGLFESTPPGAKVSLIIEGKRTELGDSPQTAPLDPNKTYQVLFEKAGFVSVNKPIQFTGATEEKMNVKLEEATPAVTGTTPPATTPPVTTPPVTTPPVTTPPVTTPPVTTPAIKKDPVVVKQPKQPVGPVTRIEKDPPAPKEPKVPVEKDPPAPKVAKGTGTLMLGSKPSCDIFVDGSSTGLHTPQRELKLAAGKHKITLVNNEFGIKESFFVEIKADESTKAIKDYSDKLPD